MTSTINRLLDEFAQAYHSRQIAKSTEEVRRTEEQLVRAYGNVSREIEQEIYNAKNGISVLNILDSEKITS